MDRRIDGQGLLVRIVTFMRCTEYVLNIICRDTSARPKHVTNWEGKVVLGYLEDGDDTN